MPARAPPDGLPGLAEEQGLLGAAGLPRMRQGEGRGLPAAPRVSGRIRPAAVGASGAPTQFAQADREFAMTKLLTAAQVVAEDRGSGWLQTATGGQFWPLDPRPEEVKLADIAHALAMKCRYGGHSRGFYSVAEHSVLLSRLVAPENVLWALLHDAAEAYLADIPRPVKQLLPGWKAIEHRVQAAVCERFLLSPRQPDEVTRLDWAITTDEKAVLMPGDLEWAGLAPPTGARIECWAPERARAEFIRRFVELRPMQPYAFTRDMDGRQAFCVVELMDDQDAVQNALCNPGTLKVEDMHGNVVWRLQ